MSDNPRFVLDLSISRIGATVRVEDPLLINEQIVAQAWQLLNDFLMDTVDDLGMEDICDEEFRALFIELCYKLIYREGATLFLFPVWERNFVERLAKGKRIRKPPKETT